MAHAVEFIACRRFHECNAVATSAVVSAATTVGAVVVRAESSTQHQLGQFVQEFRGFRVVKGLGLGD